MESIYITWLIIIAIVAVLPILIFYAFKSDIKDRKVINDQIKEFLVQNGFQMIYKTIYIHKISNTAVFIDGFKLSIQHGDI